MHSGNYAIAVTDGGNQALAFNRGEFNSSPYANLTFWVNGGSSGGQLLQVWGLLDYNALSPRSITALLANTWQQVTVPLSALGVAEQIQPDWFLDPVGRSGGAQPRFM